MGATRPDTSAPFYIKAQTDTRVNRRAKELKRLMDREHKKHHALIQRRITSDMLEPPIFVAVVGPPGVGKSTLIKSLIKHYTHTTIKDSFKGPMTILSSMHRRITFLEVPNDLNAMIDVAKTCDLALLLIDASYGFEMETFEFLTAAQIHGFPRVMGVLTNLDRYKELEKKQKIVYHVKHRFWKEIYAGAKLFILKGKSDKDGMYLKTDLMNLVKFISVLKFRPLTWRNSHSYLLCDRYEDLTEPARLHLEGRHIDRRLAFYGYVRGCNLRHKSNIHICGVGDFEIESIFEMEDPMPTKGHEQKEQEVDKSRTLRALARRKGKVYAPQARMGPVVFDKDTAYITVRASASEARFDDLQQQSYETDRVYAARLKEEGGDQLNNPRRLVDVKWGDSNKMVSDMFNETEGVSKKMAKSSLRLFAGSKPLSSADVKRFLEKKKISGMFGKNGENGNGDGNGEGVDPMGYDDNDNPNAYGPTSEEWDKFKPQPSAAPAIEYDENDNPNAYGPTSDEWSKFMEAHKNKMAGKKEEKTKNDDDDGKDDEDDKGPSSSSNGPPAEEQKKKETKDKKPKPLKTKGILKREGNYNVERTQENDGRMRRRVRFDDEVKPGDDGGIELKDDAMQFADGDEEGDDDDDEDQDIDLAKDEEEEEEGNRGYDFNAESSDAQSNDESKNDSLPSNQRSNGNAGNKASFWNEQWLETPKEKERAKQEQRKQFKKKQKKLKQGGASKSTSESNTRWKQNLLANASEIWKPKMTLTKHIYGEDGADKSKKRRNQLSGGKSEDSDSDSDDDFFKIEQPKTMEIREIDDEDSAVTALRKFQTNLDAIYSKKNGVRRDGTMDEDDEDGDVNTFLGDENGNDDDDDVIEKQQGFKPELRQRFVTGDWLEAAKNQRMIERRAKDVNPDAFDEDIMADRAILEDLGAETEEQTMEDIKDEELDWEYKLEKMMKAKGASGDITMEDKLAFAQSGGVSGDGGSGGGDPNNTYGPSTDTYGPSTGAVKQKWKVDSTMKLEDMARLEAKIKKKQQFDREFDEGLLTFDKAFDKTGATEEEQRKVFMRHSEKNQVTKNRDRGGKIRARGGLGFDDRKNTQGTYYMDMVREQMSAQNERNVQEFIEESTEMKQQYRGFEPGTYVKIIVDGVPGEFEEHFDLTYPVIIGALLPQEMQFGLIQVRMKKHRWFKRLLKFNDPLTVSAGWRRYQTCPLYCMEDRGSSVHNKRLRMIKYTPEHLHCLAVFYGPIIPPNTGFIGYQKADNDIKGFRIAATGNVLSSNLSYKIVKKLKLVGEPREIHRNTVWVKGMFKSNIEVSKFIGAKLQTVSGIRGAVKKADGKFGNFRASFEDKLLKSDIIFLKSWVQINPHKFYYGVRNLLLRDKMKWNDRLMKTVGELKYIHGKEKGAVFKEDSIYNKPDDLKRNPLRKFNKLVVPKKLEQSMPFRLRRKHQRDLRTKKEKHLDVQNYVTKEEKEAQKFVSSLALIALNHNEREKAQKRAKRLRKRKFEKKRQAVDRVYKRRRIKRALSMDKNEDTGHQFEATRGNKFYREWRLTKQRKGF